MMQRVFTLLLAIAVMAIGTVCRAGPSLDCARAATPIDRTICQDSKLGDVEGELTALYNKLRSGLPPPAARHLEGDQLQWLAGRMHCRGEPPKMVSCLQDDYESRRDHLKAISRFTYPFISEHRIAETGKASGIDYDIDIDYPQFDAPGIDHAALNRRLSAEARTLADGSLPKNTPPGSTGEWFATQTYDLNRPGPQAVSVRIDAAGFTGGAHGFASSSALLVDLRTGKVATLEDVFGTETRWLEVLKPLVATSIQKEIDENSCFEMPDADKLSGLLREPRRYVFGSEGLTIIFNAYEIGPYVCGPHEVELAYDLLRSLFRGDGPLAALR